MDAVDQGRPDWIDVLGAWAWLFVLLELDFLFWVSILRLIGAL